MRLRFHEGTVSVQGASESARAASEFSLGHDPDDLDADGDRRLPGLKYREVRDRLRDAAVSYDDEVLDPVPCPDLSCDLRLRPYQREALDRWRADRRGVVVLPTGAGKTYVGMAAIAEANCSAFVVVPTLDLVDQWRDELSAFGIEIGEFSGREKSLRAITVSTYDSAYAHAESLGNRFELVIFDEVHHLVAESYRRIAECFAAPYRLGLTATYERDDGRHARLGRLLGGKVYEIDTDDLTGEYLSEYTTERINLDLTPDEQAAYEERARVFRNYIIFSNVELKGPGDYRKLVLRSGSDPRAWRALRAQNEARKIASNSEAKLDELANLLASFDEEDRIIIFTRYNELVHRVSDRFFVPGVTYKTGRDERRAALERFRDGTYSAIVSSQVLDEGVDVPDANVGIILSGTGSSREYRQRLGRILRPSARPARLYELVSNDTTEVKAAARRRR
jgi:superfamily II DNA or RNA helicase